MVYLETWCKKIFEKNQSEMIMELALSSCLLESFLVNILIHLMIHHESLWYRTFSYTFGLTLSLIWKDGQCKLHCIAYLNYSWTSSKFYLQYKIFVTPETVASVHGILQARILKWVAIPFSRSSNPGIEPESSILQAYSLLSEQPGKPEILIAFY